MHSLNAKHYTIYNEWRLLVQKSHYSSSTCAFEGCITSPARKAPVNILSSWKAKCASFPLNPLWSAERKEKSCNFVSSLIFTAFHPYFPHTGQSGITSQRTSQRINKQLSSISAPFGKEFSSFVKNDNCLTAMLQISSLCPMSSSTFITITNIESAGTPGELSSSSPSLPPWHPT